MTTQPHKRTRAASITWYGFTDMQVCVPSAWTDDDIVSFANRENPAGTDQGWTIRKQGHKDLGKDPERNPCVELDGYVHVVLDC